MTFLARLKRIAETIGLICFVLLALYGVVALVRSSPLQIAWAQTDQPGPSSGEATVLEASAATGVTLPSVVHYQGDLRDNAGQLLEGTYMLTFQIYDTPVGGGALWYETHSNVPVRAGHFSVLLGDATPLPATLFSGLNRYIGFTVGLDAEMIPRQRFSVVPYAFWAGGAAKADQAVNADQAARAYGLNAPNGGPVDAVTVNGSGQVGIGTASPVARLDVNGSLNVQSAATVGANLTIHGNDFYLNGRGGGVGNNNGVGRALVDGGPSAGLVVNFGNDFGKVQIDGPTNIQGSLDVAGNLKFSGQKICIVAPSGDWRDTVLVPASWTAATCNSLGGNGGGAYYQLGCIFENSFSRGSGGDAVPSPNCGW